MAQKEPDATLAMFAELPDIATEALEKRSQTLAADLAAKAAEAARRQGRQASLVAPFVEARRAAVPIVSMGGSALVGRNQVPVFKVMWGAEFGASHLPQFRPARGLGYWFFPTLRDEAEPYTNMWRKIADELVEAFEGGGTFEITMGGI